MIAAINKTYGPPSVLEVVSIDDPKPKHDELLVRVHYSSVNRTDCGFLRAKPFVTRFFTGMRRPKYQSLGCEFSGVVVDIGRAVIDYKIGDRVFGFDDAGFGGHSELKCISVQKAVQKIPEGVSLQDAAIATEGAHYALYYLYAISPSADTRVFVNGATGGIGSAGVQLLKEKGAYVCATSTSVQVGMVKGLGADKVIDWQTTNIADHVGQYDAFFDAVGKSSFKTARKLLRPGGLYLSSELGAYGQNPLFSLINPIQRMFTGVNIGFPIPFTRVQEVIEIARLLSEGSFKPILDREYELKDIAEAYEYVESGLKVGNVLVRVIDEK